MVKGRKKFYNIFSCAERAKHFLITQYYNLKTLITFHAMVFKNRHTVGSPLNYFLQQKYTITIIQKLSKFLSDKSLATIFTAGAAKILFSLDI